MGLPIDDGNVFVFNNNYDLDKNKLLCKEKRLWNPKKVGSNPVWKML